jgi:acetyltransferase
MLQQSHPDDGETLRQRVLDAAKPYLLRIMGPDHLGYAVPSANVNASLSSNRPLAGHDRPALPVGGGDAQRDRLGQQPRDRLLPRHLDRNALGCRFRRSDRLPAAGWQYPRAILMYMENTRNRRKFVSAARAAARVKPVIVLETARFPGRADRGCGL